MSNIAYIAGEKVQESGESKGLLKVHLLAEKTTVFIDRAKFEAAKLKAAEVKRARKASV